MMEDKKIFEKLEEIYSTESGKKFISHLLRSFFPVGKGTYLWSLEGKKNPRCCITGTKLIGREEAVGAMLKTTPEEFAAFVKNSLIIDDSNEEKRMEHPAKKYLPEDAVLGIECKDSDKLLCLSAYEQLYNFYATKLLKNDGHMKWLAKNMMIKNGLSIAKKEGKNITQQDEKIVMKKVNKPASITLGDLEVLKNLKKKLEGND